MSLRTSPTHAPNFSVVRLSSPRTGFGSAPPMGKNRARSMRTSHLSSMNAHNIQGDTLSRQLSHKAHLNSQTCDVLILNTSFICLRFMHRVSLPLGTAPLFFLFGWVVPSASVRPITAIPRRKLTQSALPPVVWREGGDAP